MKILTRAKSLCYDEYLISDSVMYKHNNLYLKVKGKWRECDETTRSLNFEDMLDRQGNKIFASLNKTGKGGDILKILQLDEDEQFEIRTVLYRESSIIIENQDFKHYCHLDMINLKFAETTGIQE